jgi:hypothetical protein
MLNQLRIAVFIGSLACTAALSGCSSGTLDRLPDGTYERESIASKEQRTADALRREGAAGAAREAQRRAEATQEIERKNATSTFFTDLVYMLYSIFANRPPSGRVTTQ